VGRREAREGEASRRVGVVAVGDPRAPGTWSGLCRWVVAALEAQGLDVVGIDAGVHGRARLPAAIRYHGRRWWWSPMEAKADLRLQRSLLQPSRVSDLHWDLRLRERRAGNARAVAEAEALDVVLHLTTNALSREPWPGVRQVAYLDATWHSQTLERIPGGAGRFPAHLVEEGVAHERDAFAQLEHVFTMGEWLVPEVEALGVRADRVTSVALGMRNRETDLGHDPEPGRLLLVAKDSGDERGVPLAVEAVARARRRRPDLHLVLAGDETYVRRFEGTPGVEPHGPLSPGEVDEQLDRASLLVNLSACQTWGAINVEAMNARTPVVALDRFAIPEITEGGRLGFVVADPDPQAVADALVDAVSDDARLRAMGEAARASVRDRFSWQRLVAPIVAAMASSAVPEDV
jgi:glycosyltransferase involved in cell wall biosynthesis